MDFSLGLVLHGRVSAPLAGVIKKKKKEKKEVEEHITVIVAIKKLHSQIEILLLFVLSAYNYFCVALNPLMIDRQLVA